MTPFHVLHWIPDPRLHIFNGYNEVIETVIWGLRSLGHDVSYAVNQGRRDRPTIVFGAQLMGRDMLAALPEGSILYNLEQLAGLQATGRKLDDLAWASQRMPVWDYSALNLDVWQELGARNALHVPIGFAPFLSRIPRQPLQDIDVLIYGAPSINRFVVLHELCASGRSAMFVCGLYGAARDALIGRAKIILCLTSNAQSTIFSVVRASYLMANRKAVVADLATAERDIAGGVAFATLKDVSALCGHYLDHDEERDRLAERGFAAMARRDISAFLTTALAPGAESRFLASTVCGA